MRKKVLVRRQWNRNWLGRLALAPNGRMAQVRALFCQATAAVPSFQVQERGPMDKGDIKFDRDARKKLAIGTQLKMVSQKSKTIAALRSLHVPRVYASALA